MEHSVLARLLAVQRASPSTLNDVEAAYRRVVAGGYEASLSAMPPPVAVAGVANGNGTNAVGGAAGAGGSSDARSGNAASAAGGSSDARSGNAARAAGDSWDAWVQTISGEIVSPLPPLPSLPSTRPLSPPIQLVDVKMRQDVALVRQWLIGLTAKDASVMVTLVPSTSLNRQHTGVSDSRCPPVFHMEDGGGDGSGHGENSHEREQHVLRLTECYNNAGGKSAVVQFDAAVGVVDLDLKPAKKIIGYAATEKRLLALHHNNLVPQQPPCGEV